MNQQTSGLPFDDIRNLARSLPSANDDIAAHTIDQMNTELREKLGWVGECCEWYSRWSGRSPVIHRPLVTLFAGTHSIQNKIDNGSSAEQIFHAVTSVTEGSAVVNRLCSHNNQGLKLFDLALQMPVNDISEQPALDEKACAGTIAFGMEAIAGGSDLLTVCAVGPEKDLSSLAVLSILVDFDINSVLGLDDPGFAAISKAIETAKPHQDNPLEVLRRLGGRETAAICGAILAARTERVPTVVGGITGLAACAVLFSEHRDAVRHCMFANRFGVPDLDGIIEMLELKTVLDKALSGSPEADAIVASSLVRSACKFFPVVDQATKELGSG